MTLRTPSAHRAIRCGKGHYWDHWTRPLLLDGGRVARRFRFCSDDGCGEMQCWDLALNSKADWDHANEQPVPMDYAPTDALAEGARLLAERGGLSTPDPTTETR